MNGLKNLLADLIIRIIKPPDPNTHWRVTYNALRVIQDLHPPFRRVLILGGNQNLLNVAPNLFDDRSKITILHYDELIHEVYSDRENEMQLASIDIRVIPPAKDVTVIKSGHYENTTDSHFNLSSWVDHIKHLGHYDLIIVESEIPNHIVTVALTKSVLGSVIILNNCHRPTYDQSPGLNNCKAIEISRGFWIGNEKRSTQIWVKKI